MSAMALTATAASASPRKPFFARTGAKIGIQLYMLGEELTKDVDAGFAALAAIGYRDLELPSLLGKSPAELRAAADRAGVKFSSIHIGPSQLSGPSALNFDTAPQATVDALGQLGITDAVMPLALLPANFAPKPGEGFPAALARGFQQDGVDGWKRTGDALNRKAAALAPHGITVGYHNHNVEFAPLGKTTGWDVLIGELDSRVQLELDLGWVAAAGLDPAAMLLRHKGRVRWVHVKDLKASTRRNYALGIDPAEVGSGKLDWPRVLEAARKAGVQHYYVEQEAPYTIARFDAAAKSFAFLDRIRA
jgi:sugar phosphate isomerase/epimerase